MRIGRMARWRVEEAANREAANRQIGNDLLVKMDVRKEFDARRYW